MYSPPSIKQDVINTVAFWTGQLVLTRNDDAAFARNVTLLTRDLEKLKTRLTPPRLIIDEDSVEDDEL